MTGPPHRAGTALAGDPVVVRVGQGELLGVQDRGVRQFRGVPFARPPTGALRFRPPEPPLPWAGVRAAVDDPPAPVQPRPAGPAPCTSEDCLYLNVWAPAEPGSHPVYVYVHGGGNFFGYALADGCDGSSFARDGIVCVSVGYRLGVFGFLELGGLLGEDYAGSGNNGLRDLLAALSWLGDNVAAFGGDPDRVTIGGASAGGFNVCSLLASPLSRGLFRGVVSQSGGGHAAFTMDQALAAADQVAAGMARSGLSPVDLPSLPAASLVGLHRRNTGHGVVDGDVLDDLPDRAVRRGVNVGVALLAGASRDEMASLDGVVGPERLGAAETALFRGFVAAHPRLSPAEQLMRFCSMLRHGAPSLLLAHNHAVAGGSSYAYRWEWAPETGVHGGWAFHGVEQPFVWDAAQAMAADGAAPDESIRRRAGVVHRLWASFVRDGVPTAAPEVAAWPRWTPAGRGFLRIGHGVEAGAVDPEELAAWIGADRLLRPVAAAGGALLPPGAS